jgi:hypothetical protein
MNMKIEPARLSPLPLTSRIVSHENKLPLHARKTAKKCYLRRPRPLLVAAMIVATLWHCEEMFAAGTNAIRGCLTDANVGAGLNVIIVGDDRGRKVKVDARGCYLFKNLPPGNFRVGIQDGRFQGFEGILKGTTKLIVNDTAEVNFSSAVPDANLFTNALREVLQKHSTADLKGDMYSSSFNHMFFHGLASNGDYRPKIIIPDFNQCWLSYSTAAETWFYICSTYGKNLVGAKSYFDTVASLISGASSGTYSKSERTCDNNCLVRYVWVADEGPVIDLTLSNRQVRLQLTYLDRQSQVSPAVVKDRLISQRPSTFPVPIISHSPTLGNDSEIAIHNNSSDLLILQLTGPLIKTISVGAGMVERVPIQPGNYSLRGSSNDRSIQPFLGSGLFVRGTVYDYTFYVTAAP